jgi:hypothetical protein
MTGEPPVKPMTPEDVIRRIAAECAYVDKYGAVGIRLQSAAAIVRQYGEQCRQTALPQANSLRRPARPGSARQPMSLLPGFDERVKPSKPRGPGG